MQTDRTSSYACYSILKEREGQYGAFTDTMPLYAAAMSHIKVSAKLSSWFVSQHKAEVDHQCAIMLKSLLALKAARILITRAKGGSSYDHYTDFVNYASFVQDLQYYKVTLDSRMFNPELKDLGKLSNHFICSTINANGLFNKDFLKELV